MEMKISGLIGVNWLVDVFGGGEVWAMYSQRWSDGADGPDAVMHSSRGTGVFRRFVRLDLEVQR